MLCAEDVTLLAQAAFQPKRQDASMSVDLLNRALRPWAIAGIVAAAVLFLFGLGSIMLVRYAVHGEIDWQGLAAFITLVLFPVGQHFQNRHTIKRDEIHRGGLVNPAAIA